MNVSDLWWGIQMMLIGMGVVFGLLLVLVALLTLIGCLDQRQRDASAVQHDTALSTPEARAASDELDDDQLAAIAIAVITHSEVRRRSAAPEMRAHAPGSQLFASRWVSIGRSRQHSPFKRR